MEDNQEELLTPFGKVPRKIIRKLMKASGLIWDKKNKDFIIGSEHVEHWKINKADQRLSNERKWYKSYGHLPVKYNNFLVALKAQDGDIEKAIEMCELFYIENGKAVYLPDYLCEINGLDPDTRHFTYGRIFRDWETLKLTA
jgi:hypothetical protein